MISQKYLFSAFLFAPFILGANFYDLKAEVSTKESSVSEFAGQRYAWDRQDIELSPFVREIERERESEEQFSLESLSPFFSRSRVVDESDYIAALRINGGEKDKLLFSSSEKVYVNNAQDAAERDYSVYRRGTTFKDRNSGETLGLEAIYLGEGTLKRNGQIGILELTSTVKEVQKGDVIFPTVTEHFSGLSAFKTKDEIHANIIGLLDDASYTSQFKSVVIDKGSQDDVMIGHVIKIQSPKEPLGGNWYHRLLRKLGRELPLLVNNKKVNNPRLTGPSGTIMVYRVFDKVSLGLVTSGTDEIARNRMSR